MASARAARTAAAGVPEAPSEGVGEYPVTMYRKAKIDAKHPNGYEARQFADPVAVAGAGADWKASPADL